MSRVQSPATMPPAAEALEAAANKAEAKYNCSYVIESAKVFSRLKISRLLARYSALTNGVILSK